MVWPILAALGGLFGGGAAATGAGAAGASAAGAGAAGGGGMLSGLMSNLGLGSMASGQPMAGAAPGSIGAAGGSGGDPGASLMTDYGAGSGSGPPGTTRMEDLMGMLEGDGQGGLGSGTPAGRSDLQSLLSLMAIKGQQRNPRKGYSMPQGIQSLMGG